MLNINIFVIFILFFGVYADSCPKAYSTCNPGKDGMLNVHIVPHTHDDVGWLKTVDQYYYGYKTATQKNSGVQYILDTVMDELAKDVNRKFVYVELAFFWRWWNEQDDAMKEKVRNFVNEGRLEFVIGAWCMNDEATTYYNDIIDQQTLGLQFILKEFGECARPRTAWQLDPFGHSREQASLFAQFGFDGVFLGRLDYQEDRHMSDTNTREFVWKASVNLGSASEIFSGILANLYQPPTGFCFDEYCESDPIMDNPNLEDYNVDTKIADFLTFVNEKKGDYKSNNLLITMGSDFQYTNARMWYKNLDKLIRYANLKSNETNVNLFYSTPACYLHSLYNSNLTWTTKQDDFFPYANKPHSFWTGYFTSRVTLKGYVRNTNNYLQAVRQLTAISQLNTQDVQQSLFSLDEAMGILQHHDAVSGTEKQHVARDYAKRLAIGTEKLRPVIVQAYSEILSMSGFTEHQYCPLLNISECLPVQNKDSFTVVVYNPLAREHEAWIRAPVSSFSYSVVDAYTGADVESYVSEIYAETKAIPERQDKSNYEILFRTLLPPLGIKVFNISNFMKETNDEAKIKSKVNSPFQIQNQNVRLTFSEIGELVQIQGFDSSGTPLTANLTQHFCYYDSFIGINPIPNEQSSGAYVFRPKHQNPTCFNVTNYTIHQNSLVQEIHQIFTDWLSQTIRLYDNSNTVEFEWQVGPIPVEIASGKEVITRFQTDLISNKTFYTDANGREMLKRVRDYRPSWNFNQTEPVSGNYYPINSRIFIRDEINNQVSPQRQLTFVTDRTHGGSSILDGSLELMLHRRVLWDDTLGVWEPLDEMGLDLRGLIAKGKHYLVFNTTKQSAQHHRDKAHKINMLPLVTFINDSSKINNKFTGLQQSLPKNVELLTLVHDPSFSQSGINALLIRFEHFYELNEDPILSEPVTIDLNQLFNGTFTILDIEELALGANMPVSQLNERLQWNYNNKRSKPAIKQKQTDRSQFSITLQPMQIRTFRLWYLPKSK